MLLLLLLFDLYTNKRKGLCQFFSHTIALIAAIEDITTIVSYFFFCLVLYCCVDLLESRLIVALVTDDRCSLWTGDVGCLHAFGALNQIKLDLQTRVCASVKSVRE